MSFNFGNIINENSSNITEDLCSVENFTDYINRQLVKDKTVKGWAQLIINRTTNGLMINEYESYIKYSSAASYKIVESVFSALYNICPYFLNIINYTGYFHAKGINTDSGQKLIYNYYSLFYPELQLYKVLKNGDIVYNIHKMLTFLRNINMCNKLNLCAPFAINLNIVQMSEPESYTKYPYSTISKNDALSFVYTVFNNPTYFDTVYITPDAEAWLFNMFKYCGYNEIPLLHNKVSIKYTLLELVQYIIDVLKLDTSEIVVNQYSLKL